MILRPASEPTGLLFVPMDHRGRLKLVTHAVDSPVPEECSFRIRPVGSGFVSFESVAYPGCFMRHDWCQIWIDEKDVLGGSFDEDSSFKLIPWSIVINGAQDVSEFLQQTESCRP